tara:strand:+ start:410 stop:802 length:393 start_codon:yes stop_codon:yes gene_type:complete
MPLSYPILSITKEAGEDLSSFQFMAVTLESDDQLDAHDAVTDVPFGVLQNKPDTAGKAAEIMVVGRTKVEFGETVAVGNLIRFGANSKAYIFAVDTDVTAYCAGVCTEGGDSGEVGEALINCINPFRGEE